MPKQSRNLQFTTNSYSSVYEFGSVKAENRHITTDFLSVNVLCNGLSLRYDDLSWPSNWARLAMLSHHFSVSHGSALFVRTNFPVFLSISISFPKFTGECCIYGLNSA